MKTNLVSALRLTALAATLTFVSASVSAKDLAPADRAEDLLALHGSVPVKQAGPYVEMGTYKIQVSAKLGSPSARLADGTWLYQHYQVEGGEAAGTLVVRFNPRGRVSGLTLVTPAVATAMSTPKQAGEKVLVAANK